MASKRIGFRVRRGGLAPLDVLLWMVVLGAVLCVAWQLAVTIAGRQAPAPQGESAAPPPAPPPEPPHTFETAPSAPSATPVEATPRTHETNRPDPDIPPGEIAS